MSSNRLRLNPSKTELIWLGTSRRLLHCEGLGMTVCGADFRPVELCSRSWCPNRQQHDTLESRQQCSWHLFLSAAPATHHPTFPDDRCCTLAGLGFNPHSSRLLQRTSGCWSEVPAREVTVCPSRRRQTYSAAPISCICFCHHATAAALARDAGSRQVQTVYAGIQMPTQTRSSLSVRSLHTRHGARSAEIICDT